MNLKVGAINNVEKKFVVVRHDGLDSFLSNLELCDEYLITQFYYDGYKYREIKYSDSDIKYTKSIKNGEITHVTQIDSKTYNDVKKLISRLIIKHRKTYEYNGFNIDVDEFILPCKFIMVEVSSKMVDLNSFEAIKGTIEVTDNIKFKNANIINGSVTDSNTYLEGTDGVGKTTIIKKLLNEGIICYDRDFGISNYMLKGISLSERIARYSIYLKNVDHNIVFLVNNDKNEIMRRVYSRSNISEFDRDANIYNDMYNETFYKLEESGLLNGKLFRVDCTHKSVDSEVDMVKEIIFNKSKLRERGK